MSVAPVSAAAAMPAASQRSALEHVTSALCVSAADGGVDELLQRLQEAKCQPIVDAAQIITRKPTHTAAVEGAATATPAQVQPLDAPDALTILTSAAAAQLPSTDLQSLSAAVVPVAGAVPLSYDPPGVTILDLSVSPIAVVHCISAFGQRWKPVGRKRHKHEHTGATGSSGSGTAASATEPLAADADDEITFHSLSCALFAAPPSSALSSYQIRLRQLPAALESNRRALELAEESGEVGEVGALYLERKQLRAQLTALEHELPPDSDVLETRNTMRVPLGLVQLDGRLYQLVRGELRSNPPRRVEITQLYLGGVGSDNRAALLSALLPTPMHLLDFADPAVARQGELRGGAFLRDGCLHLPAGFNSYFCRESLATSVRSKTLVSLVSLSNLHQRGGSALSVENGATSEFDGIIFGELHGRCWMNGSDFGKRTSQMLCPAEERSEQETAASAAARPASPSPFVHMAISYSADGTISIYRDGVAYGQSYRPSTVPLLFPASSRLLVGLRHHGGGSPWLAGKVRFAALYDQALTPQQIQMLATQAKQIVQQEQAQPGKK